MTLFPKKKLVVYELNEVPERILRHYVATHPRSNLAKILDGGTYANTVTQDSGILSPWSTWPTLHRGVINEKHTIVDFGQSLVDIDEEYPPVWRLLADAGVSTGVFGSLHSYPLPANAEQYAFYVPDTFAEGPETFPESLETFQGFNLAMVDTSNRNVDSGLPVAKAAEFMTRAPFLGLRAGTLLRIARQLVAEQLEPLRRVRRRTSQTELAFDFFLKQLKTTRPAFTSFFTNHVASSMHRYWPGTFPDDYVVKQLPEGWTDKFCSEIDYTMGVADQQVGELMKFCRQNPEHALVLLSSMGQAAVDSDEVVLSQLYIQDKDRFFRTLGLEPGDWQPQRAMLPRYVVRVSDKVAGEFRSKLAKISVNGEPIIYAEHEDNVFMLKFGHTNLDEDSLEVSMDGVAIDWRAAGLENTAIEDATGSYAYHIPEGILLIWDPTEQRAQNVEQAIPTHSIAPALLRALDVVPPAHMGL
jgi:hypothetical protein